MSHSVDLSKVRSKLLCNNAEAAALLGISLRSWHWMRQKLPEDATVMLGPKIVRFRVAVLERVVAEMQPVSVARSEPAQLAASRARRSSAGTPGGSSGGHGNTITQSEAQRGAGQTPQQSNRTGTPAA